MKEKLKNPVFLAFGPVVLTSILTILVDWIRKKPILTTLWIIVQWLYRKVINLLNFEIKVWWILIFLIVAVLALRIAVYIYDKIHPQEEPEYLKYTSDFIDGWELEWEWEKGPHNSYRITNFRPVCQYCGTSLAPKYGSHGPFKCFRCGNEYEKSWAGADIYKNIILESVYKKERSKKISGS